MTKHNQHNNDKTLASDGKVPRYWYSVKDGHVLSIDIRQRLLSEHYVESDAVIVNPGEEHVATRENASGIFIADPYYFKQGEAYFSNYLNSDLDKITKQGAFAGIETRAWERLPDKLIIPVLSGAHWRVVCAQIDYGERAADNTWTRLPTVTVIINDPYGARNVSDGLKMGIVDSLKISLAKLVSTYHNSVVVGPLEVKSVIIKDCDQQGIGKNSWDCAPISFRNVEDYATAAIANTALSEFEDFSIAGPSEDAHHSNLIKHIRNFHIEQYVHITGTMVVNGAQDAEIIKLIHKEAGEKPSSTITKDVYLTKRILELSPAEKMQFFATLDSIRESKKSAGQETLDTDEQDDIAYALSLISIENSPFAYQLEQHIKSSFGKIAKLEDNDITEQITRILAAVQDPSAETVFKSATDFLTHSVKEKLINHIINHLKIDLLKFSVPKAWSSYREAAQKKRSEAVEELKEKLGGTAQFLDKDDVMEDSVLDLYHEAVKRQESTDHYGGLLRGYISQSTSYSASYKKIMDNYFSDSAREKYPLLKKMHPITIPELFWLFHRDFDDSQQIAKLTTALTSTKAKDFGFFVHQANLMHTLSEALPEHLKKAYQDILDAKQTIIQCFIPSLPPDLQALETAHPGIISKFVTAIMTAKSLRTYNKAFSELVDEVIASNNLGNIITTIEYADLRYAESSFYCEELQRNFFKVEEIKIASSYMRHRLQQCGATESKFNDSVFSDPNNIRKLVDFCHGDDGDEGLGWLATDLLDSTYLIMDDLVETVLALDMSKASGIGINKKGLNHELTYFVIGMLIEQPEYQEQSIYDEASIKNACAAVIKKLTTMAPPEIKAKLQKFVEYKKSMLSAIDPKFDEQIKAFNTAWDQHNLLNIQREWYKLSAKLNMWAISQITGNASLEYCDKTEEMFDDKTIKHYRVLPAIADGAGTFTLTYKSKNHPSKDDQPLDITNVFEHLKHRVDLINDTIAQYAYKAKAHKTTNFVATELIFVVGSEPHASKTDAYKRLFIKIPVKLSQSSLISLSEVVPDPKAIAFQQGLNSETDKGITSLGSPALKKQDSVFCSERALFMSFKDPGFLSSVVIKLQNKIMSDARFDKTAVGKFKVYGMLLIEYSTFTSCDRCCGATVSQHLKGPESFLPFLEKTINDYNFFTKGSDKGASKFNMMTFVASGSSYNTQTDDILVPIGNSTYNSATQIFFEENSLDLNIHLASTNQPLIEFPDFMESTNANYNGTVYMSGASKVEKYKDEVEMALIGLDGTP